MKQPEQTQHYFSAEPQVASAPRQVHVDLRGLSFHLWTDTGVFSYGQVDRGSRVLAAELAIRPGAEVLDWGAGYGLLGIVAALLCSDCRVTMVEINHRAAALAEQNAAALHLANIRVVCGEAPEVLGDQSFDIIISNPPLRAGRAAVERLIDDAGRRLRPGGELWLVVPTKKGARRFLDYLADRFAITRTVAISGGYRVLWSKQDDQ